MKVGGVRNGGSPQVPGTHAGTRGAGELGGIIAAVYEDEVYYHRGQCDMITMILRLAAKVVKGRPGDMNMGDKWRSRRIATGGLEIGGCGTRVKPAPRGCGLCAVACGKYAATTPRLRPIVVRLPRPLASSYRTASVRLPRNCPPSSCSGPSGGFGSRLCPSKPRDKRELQWRGALRGAWVWAPV